jgi:hypothetical protein
MLKIERVEKDIAAHIHSMRDRESKIAQLQKQLKSSELSHHVRIDGLRNENFELTYTFNTTQNSLRLAQSKLKVTRSLSNLYDTNGVSGRPPLCSTNVSPRAIAARAELVHMKFQNIPRSKIGRNASAAHVPTFGTSVLVKSNKQC